MTSPPALPEPVGIVQKLDAFSLKGWVFDKRNPQLALDLLLFVDGTAVSWFRPQLRMPALARHLGWPDEAIGPAAFFVTLPEWVADGQAHTVEVRVAATGTALKSPTPTVCHTPAHTSLTRWTASAPAVSAAQPRVSVVVLNRNGSALLHALLSSWQRWHAGLPVEWIVIDHASTDDSLALLADWSQRLDLRVEALPINDSFSASCNRGAQLARGEYLFFLNNDIVWQHNALPELVRTLDDPQVGIVGMKLLKVMQAPQGAGHAHSEVQHLGVRFKLQQQDYWPYETTPRANGAEAEHGPQTVPVVTGAALLCRRADFWAVGGFDPAYFYGFEDVEFCLRLSHRLNKQVVCRNDLVALHRHGYTRLTGRESGIAQRVHHNITVLGRHIGLWSKRAWWASLLSGDGQVCAEQLTIGVQWSATHHMPSTRGNISAPEHPPEPPKPVLNLALRIQRVWPHARVLLIADGPRTHEVRGIHVLVVTSPHYNLQSLDEARADLRTVAWVQPSHAATWQAQAWWLLFDSYVAPTKNGAAQLATQTGLGVQSPSAQSPLGNALGPRLPLRVRIHAEAFESDTPTARQALARLEAAQTLNLQLKHAGLACWISHRPPKSVDPDDALAGEDPDDSVDDINRGRMVDVCVYLCPVGTPTEGASPELNPAALNIWWNWQTPTRRRKQPPPLPEGFDLVWDGLPSAMNLIDAVEKRIGHTFHSP